MSRCLSLDKNSLSSSVSERIRLGIPLLDRLLPKGVFRHSFLLLAGDSGVGKSYIAGLIAANFAKRGEKVVYLALDDEPSAIVSGLELRGCNAREYIRRNQMIFIDGYGARYGIESAEFVAESVRELEPWNLLALLRRIVDSQGLRSSGVIIIDSINPLLERYEASNVFDFVNAVRADIVKRKGVFTVTTLHTATQYYAEVAATLEYMVDILIWMQHMETALEQGYPVKQLLVKKAKGVPALAGWTPYMITDEGLVEVKVKVKQEPQSSSQS